MITLDNASIELHVTVSRTETSKWGKETTCSMIELKEKHRYLYGAQRMHNVLWPLYMCMMFVTTLGNNLIALNLTRLNLIVALVCFPSTLEKKAFGITFQALFVCCMCTGPHFRIAMNEAMGLYAMCTFVGISPCFDQIWLT